MRRSTYDNARNDVASAGGVFRISYPTAIQLPDWIAAWMSSYIRTAQGRPEQALQLYRRSLELYPNRFNSLLGAARAALAAGDRDAARTYLSTAATRGRAELQA